MFYLMNKDKLIMEFKANYKATFSEDVSFSVIRQVGAVPYGFHNITSWIEGRKASKHNAHLKKIMKRLGCDDNEGFIRMTHAVGINDTFWIKKSDEDVTWNDVSLFRNQFSDVISTLAFEGTGLYNENFSSTSPELSCDGSFRKCFRKESIKGEFGSDIFLYKRGGELGAGIEPYCECLASEIAHIIAPSSSVNYDLCRLHDKLATKCNIFTDETVGYASYSKVNDTRDYSFDDVRDFFEKIGCEQQFREMLVVDSLCFNQDRHSGNYGVLFDNETMRVLKMAPVFDLNICLLPYVEMNEFENIGDKLFEYNPKLGNDFTRIGQIAMNDVICDRLKDISDFTFKFRGDDVFSEERVKKLEEIVTKQAKAILSNEVLQTKDVFFSEQAFEAEQRNEQIAKAAMTMNEFEVRANKLRYNTDCFVSVCEEDMVQLYLENESYTVTVDFIQRTVVAQKNARNISFDKLKEESPEFFGDIIMLFNELKRFSKDADLNADWNKELNSMVDKADPALSPRNSTKIKTI